MKYTEMRRHMAFEALNILGIMAVLSYITRMWPLLLLVFVGILVAGLELIYWAIQVVEPIEPALKQLEPAYMPMETDSEILAYQMIQNQITQHLKKKYPGVRWVWENPRAQEDIQAGNPVFILTNKAGGYRRAQVIIRKHRMVSILFEEAKPDSPKSKPAPQTENQPSESEDDPIPEDFGLIAFQWVDAHIMDLNARCNEAIAKGQTDFLLPSEDLPMRESWDDICKELERNELPGAAISENGILIKI